MRCSTSRSCVLYWPYNDIFREKVIFKLAHHSSEKKIYWHLDGLFAGETQNIHEISLEPSPGSHTLKVIDEDGNSWGRNFTVISK